MPAMAAEGPGPTAPRRPTAAPYPESTAQRYAAAVGTLLLVIGVLGFVASGDFDTRGSLGTGSFVGIEVNGWENVVHIAAGAVLLLSSGRRGPSRSACRLIGAFFVVVVAWGLADGSEVFGAMPVNAGTLALHALLAVTALAAWAASKDLRDAVARDRVVVAEREGAQVVGPGSGHVGGPRVPRARIDRRLPRPTHT